MYLVIIINTRSMHEAVVMSVCVCVSVAMPAATYIEYALKVRCH